MATYQEQLQQIYKEYQLSGCPWPAQSIEIASWAISTGRYDLQASAMLRVCARELAQAMRGEYLTDKQGRRVRAKHPARTTRDGAQVTLWDDIRTAPRGHMEMAFQQRRNHVVGECRQLKADVDSYNEAHAAEPPIQLILDFTYDVAELEAVA